MLLYLFSLSTGLFLTLLGARPAATAARGAGRGGLGGLHRPRSSRGRALAVAPRPGVGRLSWLPVLSALRRDCRLVVPEACSALGGTQAPGGGLSIRQGAAAMAQLIEAEFGGRPVTLCGLSLGGWMAVRLALARPDPSPGWC